MRCVEYLRFYLSMNYYQDINCLANGNTLRNTKIIRRKVFRRTGRGEGGAALGFGLSWSGRGHVCSLEKSPNERELPRMEYMKKYSTKRDTSRGQSDTNLQKNNVNLHREVPSPLRRARSPRHHPKHQGCREA